METDFSSYPSGWQREVRMPLTNLDQSGCSCGGRGGLRLTLPAQPPLCERCQEGPSMFIRRELILSFRTRFRKLRGNCGRVSSFQDAARLSQLWEDDQGPGSFGLPSLTATVLQSLIAGGPPPSDRFKYLGFEFQHLL